MRKSLLFAALLTSLFAPARADDIAHRRCRDIVTPDGAPTGRTPLGEIWLDGYVNGLAGGAGLDKRLTVLRNMGVDQVAPMLLVYCAKNQDMTLIQAIDGIAEMMVNSLPGRKSLTLNFE